MPNALEMNVLTFFDQRVEKRMTYLLSAFMYYSLVQKHRRKSFVSSDYIGIVTDV